MTQAQQRLLLAQSRLFDSFFRGKPPIGLPMPRLLNIMWNQATVGGKTIMEIAKEKQ